MMVSPERPVSAGRRAEVQALVVAVPCGPNRGLAGIKVHGLSGGSGEYFVPFAVGKDAGEHEYVYAGVTAAIERLHGLGVERALIVVEDEQLVEELERRVEPPRELFLNYVMLGCKLNEFRRAKVVASRSSRMEELRAKTESLAGTIYNAPLLAHAI